MRAYPTVKDQPSRKSRKNQRKVIFEENRLEMSRLRHARKQARKAAKEQTNAA